MAYQTATQQSRSHTPPKKAVGLAILLLALFMAQFDLYVVNLAAPTLIKELHATSGQVELVVAGYGLAYASGLITGGRLGDIYGHRRCFLLGAAAFGATSLMCAAAPNISFLVASRLLQGFAASLLIPQVLGSIQSTFHVDIRPRALAWFGVVTGGGSVMGQILGGVLLDANILGLGWRAIFLLNVPISIATVALGAIFLTESDRHRVSVDIVGSALLALALACALVPLTLGRTSQWPLWCIVSLIASPMILVFAGTWWNKLERIGRNPTLKLSLLRNSNVLVGCTTSAAIYTALFGGVFATSVFIQEGLNSPARTAGLTIGPLGIGFALTSIACRAHVVRYGPRLIIAGVSIALAGTISLAILVGAQNDGTTLFQLGACLAIIGVGNGMSVPALTGTILKVAPSGHGGALGGLITTVQQFSASLGVAVFGTLFYLGGASDLGKRYATNFTHLSIGLVVVMIVALIAAVGLQRATRNNHKAQVAGPAGRKTK